jgi:hypothetical protein
VTHFVEEEDDQTTEVVHDHTMALLVALERSGFELAEVMHIVLETLAMHVTLASLAADKDPFEPLGFLTSCMASGHALGMDRAEEEDNPQ